MTLPGNNTIKQVKEVSIQDIIDAINGEYIPHKHRRISQEVDEALRFINHDRKPIIQRIQRAKAEMLPRVIITGKAIAEQTTAMKIPIHLVIAPLGIGNGNNQGLPVEEADNIIETAVHMPIGANFANGELLGHTGADDVGVIQSVQNDNNVIVAAGILWREKNPELIDYLQAKGEVGSSFELYHSDSKYRDGIQWLRGVIFVRHTLVANPSYGTLTPVRLA